MLNTEYQTSSHSKVHPRLQGGYTGHGKTPSQFLYFWPFLTKTKLEQTLPGDFQSKFLLGSLQLGAPYFDPDFPIILGYSHPESFFFKKQLLFFKDVTHTSQINF